MKKTLLLATTALMLSFSAAYAEEGIDGNVPPPPMDAPQHGEHSHHGPMAELMQLLPDDKQKLLKDTFEKQMKDNKSVWEQARKLHEERDALLKAPKFDEDAFLKKSAEIDALHEKMAQSHEKAIASVASQFTPEERRVLVVMGHMMHEHGHGHMHQAGWKHHPKDGAAAPKADAKQPS